VFGGVAVPLAVLLPLLLLTSSKASFEHAFMLWMMEEVSGSVSLWLILGRLLVNDEELNDGKEVAGFELVFVLLLLLLLLLVVGLLSVGGAGTEVGAVLVVGRGFKAEEEAPRLCFFSSSQILSATEGGLPVSMIGEEEAAGGCWLWLKLLLIVPWGGVVVDSLESFSACLSPRGKLLGRV
jgi:hypothetical protein